ncbi:hypothetical protein TorRG33x02_037570 [Trema orientale]|uniref:Uncharacterized protein n=1 Tax=Trema orientale TaxID=63057 RepID=A0A2P5FRG4_TREOI|nr:hypothetical protein TorRG33x02_037570 [Trema orientale]
MFRELDSQVLLHSHITKRMVKSLDTGNSTSNGCNIMFKVAKPGLIPVRWGHTGRG